MPTVSTMPFLKPHFHNNAGTPATGYKLYSYDSSTQDEIPLYKDPAGTIEYTNPLILNSRGEPDGASIYLDNTKVYKLILKTESDVPVWTETAVQGVNGNGGTSVPVINLPGFTVLGNDTGTYGEAGPIDIANSIAQNTDSRDIPNVGAIVGYTTQFLQNSGDHTYSGNLDVTGNLDVNALTIQGTSINDVFVNEDGHAARTLVGNKDVTDGAVEDIAIKNDLTSNSADEIPSVMAVKSYVDGEVSDLEDQIAAISDSYQVKVSATDNANYLEPKLVSGNRCQITKFTENNEEKLRFDLNIDDLKDISYVFQALSQVAGFDTITNNAVYAGFDSAPINFGAAFNLSDGKFTALDSGYYHFDVSALISQTGNTNTSICNMWIKHFNDADTELGSVMAFASTPPSADNHPNFTISCAANFHLAISDYVAVVFEIYDAGTLSVNKVAFGGYSLDSANGASASGTPNRLAVYDNNGDLNPAQKLVYDSLYNLLLGTGNSVSTNIAESFVVGDDNAVNAQDAMAIGHQNTIGGGSSSGIAYAVGRQNKVNAPEAMAVGIRNDVGLVSAGETVVFGIENDCDGSEMVCVGQDNDVDGAHSTVLGTDNVATNLSSVVLVGQLNNVSNAYSKTIVGQNLSGASIPYATEVGVGTNTGYLTLFGKYVDQFGDYGVRGRFLGFDADQKLKVTNEVSDVQFMTTAGVTPVEGQLSWNELDKTLNVGLAGGSTLQVGQEEVVYAMNLTGGPILNGEVVYVSGSQGNRVVVSRAQAVTTPTSQVFIAVATQVINDNQMGYFTRFGIVREVNTAAYLEGDILWVSTAAGAMTNSKPNKPYSQIAVAIVTRAHAQQGTIMVSPYVVPRLSQLTDVEVTGATDGQALVYQASTGLWIPGTATGGVSDGTVKVTASDSKGYLENQMIGTGTVSINTIGGGGHFTLNLRGNGKVAIDDVDDVVYEAHGYIADKIVAGDNITTEVIDSGTDKTFKISAQFTALDDAYPIIAEYGNTSGVTLPSNNTGIAISRVAGKSSEFALPTPRIDNFSKFDVSTGVFAPEKAGYYVASFKGFARQTSSTSLNIDVNVGIRVETSYDGSTWVAYGSDSSKWFTFNAEDSYQYGDGVTMAFDMVIDMLDNEFSGAHKQARIIVQQNSFGGGFNNSMYITYPQIYFYELKKPVGIQGPQGDQGPAGTVDALNDIPDVDIVSVQGGQVLTYDAVSGNWENQYTTISGAGDIGINDLQTNDVITWNGSNWQNAPQSGGADTYTVKVGADDNTPGYLGDKIAVAAGSPLTMNVVGDTLILDAIESDITDPLIQTIGLMSENGTMGFTGNAYSSVYADGEWATGFGQNTSDAYYRVSTIGRGTINKVKFFVNSYNDVDNGISPPGNYGAIRIGLFTLGGVCKGMTAWTRGLQTLGTNTLTMIPEAGQNLTLERNGEYWIGIVSRGVQLISYNKAASGFNPVTNALRYAVSIRSSSSGADWSPNFWNTTGGGFIQVKVPCVFMASTDS